MKKWTALLLVFLLAAGLCACGKANTASEPAGPDVEYYAKLGQMPECDYALGADAAELEKTLSAAAEADPESAFFTTYETHGLTALASGAFGFYYPTDGKKAIRHIVSFEKAYDFATGTVVTEVKEALSARGFDAAERDLAPDEVFFLPGSVSCTALEYAFGDNTVTFVFQENALCATVLSAHS